MDVTPYDVSKHTGSLFTVAWYPRLLVRIYGFITDSELRTRVHPEEGAKLNFATFVISI